jgi:hypothetical protein
MRRFITFLNESNLQIETPKSFVGEATAIHPVIKVAPSHEDYMKWSFRISGRHAGDASTIHLKDVRCAINHTAIDRTIRNPEDGRKRPIILLEGTIEDIDFPLEDIKNRMNTGTWHSVTYNPHKHPEFVSRKNLPAWWCGEPRFQDKMPRSDFNIERREAMVDYRNHPDQPLPVTHKQGSRSMLTAKEAILKQHNTCNEDYMWIKI